jgi:hypothetical protein
MRLAMCCIVLSMAFLGPRFAFLLVWIFDTSRVNAAYSSFIWPLLGLLFAPWTILAYTIAWGPLNGVSGAGWILVALGVILDLVTYSSRQGSKAYQARGAV